MPGPAASGGGVTGTATSAPDEAPSAWVRMTTLARKPGVRVIAIALLVLAAMLLAAIGSATYLRSSKGYSKAVQSGKLSSQTAVGYYTDDLATISLLRQIEEKSLGGIPDPDKPDYSVLKSGRVTRVGELPQPPDDSPASDLMKADRGLATLLRGVEVSRIWEVAPLLVFGDDEHRIAESFVRFTARTENAFAITDEPDEEGYVDEGPKSALLGFLWYTQALVLPKVRRLIGNGQVFAAQRLMRTTLEILNAFSIRNDALDGVTLRRVNAVYLAAVLLERPVEVMAARSGSIEAIDGLLTMMDPDTASDDGSFTLGPANYATLANLAYAMGQKNYESIDEAAVDALQLTPLESDLANLLLIRAAFWQAWSPCTDDGRDERLEGCGDAAATFRRVLAKRGPALHRESFRRDVARYHELGAGW